MTPSLLPAPTPISKLTLTEPPQDDPAVQALRWLRIVQFRLLQLRVTYDQLERNLENLAELSTALAAAPRDPPALHPSLPQADAADHDRQRHADHRFGGLRLMSATAPVGDRHTSTGA